MKRITNTEIFFNRNLKPRKCQIIVFVLINDGNNMFDKHKN